MLLWRYTRREARFTDAHLHDLRHSFASYAVLQGLPLQVVSCMLGHRWPRMTLRHARVGDRENEAAGECIGMAITMALDGI